MAGLVGSAYGGKLHLRLLWVNPDYRSRGLGRQLMDGAEEIAIDMGCTSVVVDTMSFQAPEFYVKLGYQRSGVFEGYAGGASRHYFEKQLWYFPAEPRGRTDACPSPSCAVAPHKCCYNPQHPDYRCPLFARRLPMPVFTPEYLEKAAYHIYVAKGAPPEEAEIVAAHQVKANLVGHDSHGVIHIPEYCERVDRGHIVPGAPFEVLSETPTTAVVDGHWGFGFVVTEKATRMAIDKAKQNGVAAFTIRRQSHIGRLGDYPTICAQEGMIAILTADSGAGPKAVAPFGGRARRLGTNPICIGVPSNLPGQVLLDMATSAVAAGKIGLARNRGEQVPTGWIVDKDGNPTNDPNDYAAGGAILPVGADQGHKGFGLSFMVEMFSGLLTGLGFGIDPQARHNDGCFLAVFDVAKFRPLEDFKQEMTEFAEFVKTSPPAAGFSEVYYPGEIEYRTELQRRENGIFIEDETWRQISDLMDEVGVTEAVGQP